MCLQGDEDAWKEFFRRFARLIAGLIYKTLQRSPIARNSSDPVSDLVHDALKRLFVDDCRPLRKLEWRHDKSLRGLVLKTASTTALDYVRKLKTIQRDVSKEISLEEPGVEVPTSHSFVDQVHSKIFLEQVAKCLYRLLRGEPDQIRDVAIFLLYYGQKITAKDISRIYHLNVRKVENIVARMGRLARAKDCL